MFSHYILDLRKSVACVTLIVTCLLVPDCLVSVFPKLLIFDFLTHSWESTCNCVDKTSNVLRACNLKNLVDEKDQRRITNQVGTKRKNVLTQINTVQQWWAERHLRMNKSSNSDVDGLQQQNNTSGFIPVRQAAELFYKILWVLVSLMASSQPENP